MSTHQATSMTVGKRLKEERQRLGMSLDAFGDAGGVGKGAQINYEKDARAPDSDYLIGIDSVGADVLYVLLGKRRIDLATTDHERALLSQAIEYVLQSKSGSIEELAPAIQAEYDRRYSKAGAAGGVHPGHSFNEREQALLAHFQQTNEEGRKVIERIAQLEAARFPRKEVKTAKSRSIAVKGNNNVAGENISVGSFAVGDGSVKKR